MGRLRVGMSSNTLLLTAPIDTQITQVQTRDDRDYLYFASNPGEPVSLFPHTAAQLGLEEGAIVHLEPIASLPGAFVLTTVDADDLVEESIETNTPDATSPPG